MNMKSNIIMEASRPSVLIESTDLWKMLLIFSKGVNESSREILGKAKHAY